MTDEDSLIIKSGDKLICISKPEAGCYQCNIGVVATVKKIYQTVAYFNESICIDSYKNGECFDIKYFNFITPPINKILWRIK